MAKSRVRKNRGKGKGAKERRRKMREHNERIRAGVDELSIERRMLQLGYLR